MNLLDLRGLTKSYGTVTALRDFNLTVAAGSCTAVVGPSASGKTTLLRLIAGFETPNAGEIRLGGEVIADAAAAVPPHRRNIGLVMQDGALFPHLTVRQNIAFGLPRATPDATQRVHALMDTVELDRAVAARRPHELSGGQQQRVALARALMRQPRLMLLDEPFSALDAGLREQTRKAVAGILTAAGITTILVTHDQAEAMEFADQIAVLRYGQLQQSGPPRQVYLAPKDRATAAFLGQAIILGATIAKGVATCSLGQVAVDSQTEGAATIMLRPEQITLDATASPGAGGAAIPGVLLAADFAGPSATVTLALKPPTWAETTLTFRTPGPGLPAVGSHVAVTVTGPAHVFTQTEGGAAQP